MNKQEELNKLFQTHRELSFVKNFLHDFPDGELFLVGGTVRDLLMKRKSLNGDFDFVVRLVHIKDIESWFSAYGEMDFVGRVFGVYKFTPDGLDHSHQHPIDIALPRTEKPQPESQGGYKDFDIQFNTELAIQEDLARRDYTINAMAINMRNGDFIDPFGGEQDIRDHIIRAVGNPQTRFDEDLSRMLRGIRLVAELNFSFEEKTEQTILTNISRIHTLRNRDTKTEYIVPRETIGQELAKALSRNPAHAISWFQKTGLMKVFYLHSSHTWTQKELDQFPHSNPTLTISLLLHTKDLQTIPHILGLSGLDSLPRGSKLRIEQEDVLWLVARFQEINEMKHVTELRASLFEKFFLGSRGVLLLQGLSILGYPDVVSHAQQRITEIRTRWSVEPQETIPSLLSGNDLLNAGIPAGPTIRETLELLRDQQLDGKILTREQAKSWLKTQIHSS